jgi:hypothetical protein
MRTTIALSVCCAAAVAISVVWFSNQNSVALTAPRAIQVVTAKPSATTQPSAAEPAPIVVTQTSAVQDASPPSEQTDTTPELLAQAPAEKETEAKAKVKPESKKRAAPAAKKDSSDAKKTPPAKAGANGDDLKSLKKELAQARRDRTALDKRIAALEKQVEELEAAATDDAKSPKDAKGEKSTKGDGPKAEKSKAAAPKASAVKRKATKVGAAAA